MKETVKKLKFNAHTHFTANKNSAAYLALAVRVDKNVWNTYDSWKSDAESRVRRERFTFLPNNNDNVSSSSTLISRRALSSKSFLVSIYLSIALRIVSVLFFLIGINPFHI